VKENHQWLSAFPSQLLPIIACLGSAGASQLVLAQSEIPVPMPTPSGAPALPHESVLALISAVQSLVASNDLTEGQARSLIQELNQAHAELNRGGARAALQRLEAFTLNMYDLVASGVLGSSGAQLLVAGAGRAQAEISELAFGTGPARPASWSFTGCAEKQPCTSRRGDAMRG